MARLGQLLGPPDSTGPAVLDWHTGLDLATALPEYAVFTPWDSAPTLPYVGGSVDVVVLPSAGPARLAEARRVARHAVLMCSPAGLPELRLVWSGPTRRPGTPPIVNTGFPPWVRRVLVCAPRLPELDRQSGSRRMFDFVRLLTGGGVEVTFLAGTVEGQDRYAGLLRRMGVSVHTGAPHVIRSGRFDLVLIAFWHLAERLLPVLRANASGARVVVDSVDLEFVRRAGQAAVDPSGDDPGRRADDRRRELAAYAASDGVLVVSDDEARLLRAELPAPVPVSVVPDGEDITVGPLPFEQRRGVVFVANFWHPPNIDALDHLVHDILPTVDPAVLARHPLTVVGNGADRHTVEAIGRIPHSRLVGWVPSVLPYLHHARASVLPLRYGAGTKRKLIQALLAGTATVSTSVGTHGLPVRDRTHLLVADDPASFGTALTRLLTEPGLWRHLTTEGRRAMAARHDGAAVAKAFGTAIRAVSTRPVPRTVRPAAHTGRDDGRVLVAGIILAEQTNNGRAVITELGSAQRYAVEQRWASIGRPDADLAGAGVILTVPETTAKIPLLRRLLADVTVADYEFLVLCDDDVTLPAGFLDRFLDLQRRFGFALAQPARTENSYIDHPIVQRQPGVQARRTLFVESGPVVSAHRSALGHLLPFPAESPMGWGNEEIWSHRLHAAGLSLGIIDAVPVEHRLRPPTAHYRWEDAERGRAALLAAHTHRPLDECLRVLDVFAEEPPR